MSTFYQKLLESLKASIPVGGLEIGDSILRWSSWRNGEWQLSSLRLPPGIVSGGIIKDFKEFTEALREFKSEIGLSSRSKIPVVVSLASLKVYLQIFTLPLLPEDKLEEAVKLNLQMSSPIPYKEAYSGYELLWRDENAQKSEYLGGFIDQEPVNEILKAMEETGFMAVSLEPRGLSITRVVRKFSSFEHGRSYILMAVDANGLEFIVLRNGNLYFDYFNTWKDLEAENREISTEGFRDAVVKSLQQVLNFYRARWSEPIDSILLASTSLTQEIKDILKGNFPFEVQELALDLGGASNEWLIALGAGIRGSAPLKEDRELSLLGVDTKAQYRREQVLNFLRFWRTIVPASLAVLLTAFLGSYYILARAEQDIKNRPTITLTAEQQKEETELGEKAQAFNKKVSMLAGLQKIYTPAKSTLLTRLTPIADAYEITLNRITYASGGAVTLTGESRIHDSILGFRDELAKSAPFKKVDLPFQNIQSIPGGFSFSMTLSFAP